MAKSKIGKQVAAMHSGRAKKKEAHHLVSVWYNMRLGTPESQGKEMDSITAIQKKHGAKRYGGGFSGNKEFSDYKVPAKSGKAFHKALTKAGHKADHDDNTKLPKDSEEWYH